MFSIIIPVHNSHTTIRRCLDSILDQTYRDFECIIVENGSNDDSLEICCEYADKDSRFTVIHISKSNGPSRPRNIGMVEALGDYILFVDSDDWIDRECLSEYNKLMQNYDIVFSGYYNVKDNNIQNIIIPTVQTNTIYKVCKELSDRNCFGYTWCKAIRKCIIGEHAFDEAISVLEDELFTLKLAIDHPKIGIIGKPLYYYNNSMVTSLSNKFHRDFINIIDMLFCAWKRFFEEDKYNYVAEIRNKYIKQIRYYIFEHADMLNYRSYMELLNSHLFYDAFINSHPLAIRYNRGYFFFLLDFYIFKTKHYLYKALQSMRIING